MSALAATGDGSGLVGAVPGRDAALDKDHWLSSPKREEVFGPLGATDLRTFGDPQDPTKAAVVMDVADLDALMAFMREPGAGTAMEHDGVVPETLRMLVEERGSAGWRSTSAAPVEGPVILRHIP